MGASFIVPTKRHRSISGTTFPLPIAIIHGCTIHDNVLIGMGAIIMDGAVVESNSIIAAGALVSKDTIVESGSVYAGIPAKK